MEARRSESRADFVHKLRIAAKEAGESVYWFRLAHHARLVDADVDPLAQEGTELTAILTASVATARRYRFTSCSHKQTEPRPA